MLRIGAVEYLNTKPLVYGLSRRFPGAKLSFDLPSRLADALASDQLDVALVPSVEFLSRDGYEIISDAAIACRGPVWSVRLLSRVPVAQIKSLALDEGSRTSAILVQLLLWEQYGLRPALKPLPINCQPESFDADAILLIGDRAMHPATLQYQEIWDLGDRWCRATELPFVFAMWVARAGRDVRDLVTALEQSRDEGLAQVEAIAAQEAGLHGLTQTDCLTYFTQHLHFRLGKAELQGLRHFAHKASDMGLLPPHCERLLDAPFTMTPARF
jgi:chorismate dehydratase